MNRLLKVTFTLAVIPLFGMVVFFLIPMFFYQGDFAGPMVARELLGLFMIFIALPMIFAGLITLLIYLFRERKQSWPKLIIRVLVLGGLLLINIPISVVIAEKLHVDQCLNSLIIINQTEKTLFNVNVQGGGIILKQNSIIPGETFKNRFFFTQFDSLEGCVLTGEIDNTPVKITVFSPTLPGKGQVAEVTFVSPTSAKIRTASGRVTDVDLTPPAKESE